MPQLLGCKSEPAARNTETDEPLMQCLQLETKLLRTRLISLLREFYFHASPFTPCTPPPDLIRWQYVRGCWCLKLAHSCQDDFLWH